MCKIEKAEANGRKKNKQKYFILFWRKEKRETKSEISIAQKFIKWATQWQLIKTTTVDATKVELPFYNQFRKVQRANIIQLLWPRWSSSNDLKVVIKNILLLTLSGWFYAHSTFSSILLNVASERLLISWLYSLLYIKFFSNWKNKFFWSDFSTLFGCAHKK